MRTAILHAAFFTPMAYGWGLPILVEGAPGGAKSAVIEAFAKRCNVPSETLSPSERGEGAFGVVPVPTKGGVFESSDVLRDSRVVDRVVRRYVRRSAWAGLVAGDLSQEGHAAVVKARGRFEPAKGEWEGYAYVAAWKAIASYLVAESSPVTRKEKGAPNLARRASEESLATFVASENVEAEVAEEEWRAKTRARVFALAGDRDVARILLEESTPALVASERGVAVARIYSLVARVRSRLAEDSALYALMQAKKGVGFSPGC